MAPPAALIKPRQLSVLVVKQGLSGGGIGQGAWQRSSHSRWIRRRRETQRRFWRVRQCAFKPPSYFFVCPGRAYRVTLGARASVPVRTPMIAAPAVRRYVFFTSRMHTYTFCRLHPSDRCPSNACFHVFARFPCLTTAIWRRERPLLPSLLWCDPREPQRSASLFF